PRRGGAGLGLVPRRRGAHAGVSAGSRPLRARHRDPGGVRGGAVPGARGRRRGGPAARRPGRDRRHPAPGVKSAGKFEKLGLRSGFDFVLHLPLRYEDETALTAPQSAPPGRPVSVEARVLKAQVMYRPKRQLVVHAEGLVLRFFHFYPSQLKQFQRAAGQGLLVRAHGEVRPGFFGAEMAHPRYRIVPAGEPLPDTLTPIYPTTAGLSQTELRARVLQELDGADLGDTLPATLKTTYNVKGFAESV